MSDELPPLPFLDDNGESRYFGWRWDQEDLSNFVKCQAVYGANIPRSEWKPTSRDTFGARVLDQDGQGSCVGHASATAVEIQWLRQGGQPVAFSACFVYGLINGGRDAGAVISYAMDALMNQGICTEAEVPPRQIYKRTFPQKAFEVASKYKVVSAYHCDSFDAIVSEIIRGRTVNYGIMVGNNFTQVDSNGIVPRRNFGGGGHALCGYAVDRVNGKWYVVTQNSWSTSFGIGGHCLVGEEMFDRPGQVDAISIEVVSPEMDDDFPKPVT